MSKETKQFLADRFVDKWIKDNKEFIDDYQKLCYDLIMFKAKWRVEIGFIFKNPQEVKGRQLGVGIIEELFNPQDFPNQPQEDETN